MKKRELSGAAFYFVVFVVLLTVFTHIERAKGQPFGSTNRQITSPQEIELIPNNYVEVRGYLNLPTQNEIRFNDSSGGEYVSLKAPATISSSIDFILPDSVGASGQVLSTDGLGGLSFVDVSSGFTPTNDNRVIRSDIGGDFQESGVTIDDTDYLFGATRIAVDSIDLNGETISNPGTGGLTIQAGSTGDLVFNPNAGEARVTGRFDVETTTESSHPCPSMTETQRDALTPSSGDCVDNTTAGQFERYDGVSWNAIAGSGGAGDVNNVIAQPGFDDETDPFTHTTGSGVAQASGGHLDDPGQASPYISLQTGTTHDHELCYTLEAGRQYEVGCQVKSTLSDISLCYNDGTADKTCNDSYDGSDVWKYVFQRGTAESGEDVCLRITSASSSNIGVDSCYIGEPRFSTAELTKNQFYLADLNTSFDIAAVLQTEGSGLFTVADNVTASRVTITALEDIYVTIGGEVRDSSRAFVAVRNGAGQKVATVDMNGTTNPSDSVFPEIFLAAGDQADVEYFNTGTLSEARFSASARAASTNVITQVSEDQPAKRAGTGTGNVFHNSNTAIDYETQVYDPSGLFVGCGSGHSLTINSTTGCRAVFPRSGKVKVCASLQLAGDSGWSETELMTLNVWKNGATDTRLDVFVKESTAVGSYIAATAGCAQIDVSKNDYAHIVAFQNNGANLASNAPTESNYVSVEYIDSKALLAGLEPPKFQKKTLSGVARDELTGYIDADDSNFRFDNLEIGKTYELYAHFVLSDSTFAPADWSVFIQAENGATVLGEIRVTQELVNSAVTRATPSISSGPFVATSTSIRFNVTTNDQGQIRPGTEGTFTWLKEVDAVETSQW